MLAELKNGSVVKLEKECTCLTHNEPHWVWLDSFEREQNKGLPLPKKEIARLDEKIRNMNRLGVVRLIREHDDDLSDLQKQQIRQFVSMNTKAESAQKEQKSELLKNSFATEKEAKKIKSIGTYKTAKLVLNAFDDLKSEDRQNFRDKKAYVERKAKEAF